MQSDEIQKQLMSIFQAELDEHLSTLNKGLLALEQEPAQGAAADARGAVLSTLFRAAHSLKGAARAVGLQDIEMISHRLEDALAVIKQSERPLRPQHIDTLLAATDLIKDVMSMQLRGESVPRPELESLFAQLAIVMSEMGGADSAAGQQAKPPDTSPAALPSNGRAPTPQAADMQPGPGPTPLPAPPSEPPVANSKQPSNPAPPTWSATSDETIRVSVAKLDALMDNLGELLVARMRMGQLVEQVHALQQRASSVQKEWRKAQRKMRAHLQKDSASVPGTPRLAESLAAHERDLNALDAELALLLRHADGDHNYLQLVTNDLHDSIRRMRMLPIATLLDYFPRMVRDLARERGKEVSLQTEGADTEVDRQTLELLRDPLTHVVRNAIDHGIEPPEERLACGKPRQGVLRLRAEQRGDRLVVEVSDDGRGIDLKAVRQAAIERGMLSQQEAAALNEAETLELIFRSGLSTTRQVSAISGRGVGMDVVRQNVEQLRGLIQAQTQAGQGATFVLTLPLTLVTSNVLLIQVAGETVGLPLMNVDRILHVDASRVGSIEGRPAIYADGRLLPLADLGRLLELPGANRPAPKDAKMLVAIIAMADKRIAARVDGFLATQEVVIKPLGRQVRRVRNVAGAAVLGSGQVVLILNPADLIKSAHVRQGTFALTAGKPEATRRRVLVVDDSITTRTLMKHILANAGYEVSTASDGQEAWDLIRGGGDSLPDIVVSDVNMPNMDGFALTETIRQDARTARLPVVLVTSLESQQDRLRGLNAGADAYLTKGAFDQRELQETIERLIG